MENGADITATTDLSQAPVNNDRLTSTQSTHDQSSHIQNGYRTPTNEVGLQEMENLPTASPRRQRLSPAPSPKVSPSPSFGITIPKLPERTQSSTTTRTPSSPSLSRQFSSSSLRGSDSSTSSRQAMRRSSTGLPYSSPGRAPSRASLNAPVEEPQILTAASVASSFFEKELDSHKDTNNSADTVVVLHDDCYGHRYSRPKTPKGTLSLIVERPERIHASVLGMSAAYVRLGGRHAGGQHPPHPERGFVFELPFLIQKSSRAIDLTSSYVTNVHGKSWMEELKSMCTSASANLASTGKELARPPNSSSQSEQLPKQPLHEGDLYLSGESLNAFEGALGGVCDGIDAIFQSTSRSQGPTKAFVCIRPPGHHCSSGLPSGFCWLNNVHVGIEYAAQKYGLTHAVILDFDLHHGDGSQSITWARNSRVAKLPKNTTAAKRLAIGYYSLHDINSFPCEWGEDEKVQNASLCIENAHNQSVWNVHLEPWKTEADFWTLYEKKYSILLDKARNFLKAQRERLQTAATITSPKAAIFLSAGFDASQWEGQGMQRHKVNVPTDFFARFTQDAVKLAQEPGLGVDGRVISVLEGGYSDKALISGVMSHLSGLTALSSDSKSSTSTTKHGLGIDVEKQLETLSLENQTSSSQLPQEPTYNSDWWSLENLNTLESLIAPPPPQPASKKRTTANNTSHYTTPTQSFTAKAVDPTKVYRSASGYAVRPASSVEPSISRIPEVDWVTAVAEFSKLIIPQDRQTKSCRPEELSEPRVKKERQSINALPSAEPAASRGRMQLRGRKSKAPSYAEVNSGDEGITAKQTLKANRRRTIADTSSLMEGTKTPPLDAQPPMPEARSEVKAKPRPEPAIDGTSAGKGTKITIRTTQPKTLNTGNAAPAVRKKAPEKGTAVSKAKPKNAKAQPGQSANATSKLGIPKTTLEQPANGNGISEEKPIATSGTDMDLLVQGMQSKLDLNGRSKENTREETPGDAPVDAPSGELSTPQPPVDALRSDAGPAAPEPALGRNGEEHFDPPVFTQEVPSKAPAAPHVPILGQAPMNASVFPQPIPSNDALTSQFHYPPQESSAPGWTNNRAVTAPNQNAFNNSSPTQVTRTAPMMFPYHGLDPTYLHSHPHLPDSAKPNNIPMFTSHGHIPFVSQQDYHQPPSIHDPNRESAVLDANPMKSFPMEEAPPQYGIQPAGAFPSDGQRTNEPQEQAREEHFSGQPFKDLPAVPDIWDVPDSPPPQH
ncbi:MAG: hypothetical protein M1820_002773 [Bogoriella megaspora]|nr:MAG: hypothetical protein M1820_002773 [Bogoriella megaspora]